RPLTTASPHLSLHDALPIYPRGVHAEVEPRPNEGRLMAIRSGTQRRREAIQGLLKTASWSISRLAVELETSESTIRRDLRDMAAAGEISRTIGGAAAPGYTEPPLGERMEQQAEAKDAIAARALERLDEPKVRTVFLDAGSTTVRLAERI